MHVYVCVLVCARVRQPKADGAGNHGSKTGFSSRRSGRCVPAKCVQGIPLSSSNITSSSMFHAPSSVYSLCPPPLTLPPCLLHPFLRTGWRAISMATWSLLIMSHRSECRSRFCCRTCRQPTHHTPAHWHCALDSPHTRFWESPAGTVIACFPLIKYPKFDARMHTP